MQKRDNWQLKKFPLFPQFCTYYEFIMFCIAIYKLRWRWIIYCVLTYIQLRRRRWCDSTALKLTVWNYMHFLCIVCVYLNIIRNCNHAPANKNDVRNNYCVTSIMGKCIISFIFSQLHSFHFPLLSEAAAKHQSWLLFCMSTPMKL